jgi:subtilase family serine protease
MFGFGLNGKMLRRTATAATIATASCLSVASGAVLHRPGVPTTRPAASRFAPAMGVHPHYRRAGDPRDSDGDVAFACQDFSAGANTCLGPHQLQVAYRIQPLLDRGINGAGRTIVIVDAYAPPGVGADLHTFDALFHLPDPQLRVIAPQGAVWDAADDNQRRWAGEIDLDVQLAHTVAPGAKVVLVEARSDLEDDVNDAMSYAVDQHLGDVLSLSFGEDERCVPPAARSRMQAIIARSVASGMTVVAASGDQGAAQYVCDETSNNMRKGVWFPASDPLSLGVGGTQLTANPVTGVYRSEKAWDDRVGYALAGGGGFSTLFARPAYQNGTVHGAARGVPDIAYSAATKDAALIYWGQDGATGDFYAFDGTSLGTPQWGGLIALSDQLAGRRLGMVNASLYQAPATSVFHDITTGNNSVVYTDDNGVLRSIRGYPAIPGWDAVTGLGSPIADKLVPYLAAAG